MAYFATEEKNVCSHLVSITHRLSHREFKYVWIYIEFYVLQTNMFYLDNVSYHWEKKKKNKHDVYVLNL